MRRGCDLFFLQQRQNLIKHGGVGCNHMLIEAVNAQFSVKSANNTARLANDTHGGGDLDLVRDFVAYVRGDTPSVSCTSINDSLAGHLVVFLADKSRENNGIPEKVIL